MRYLPVIFFSASLLAPLPAQEPGQGAPAGIGPLFVEAFYRNRFNAYVSTPAVGNVRTFGTGGYVQEFSDAKDVKTNKFALVKGTAVATAGASTVFQVYPALYSYYNTIGVNTAGFPTSDTNTCITYSDPGGTAGTSGAQCTYALFTKNYALFSYPSSFLTNDSSANYAVRDPFYTKWNALGSVTFLGPAISAESTATSKTSLTYITQQYYGGNLYDITSGALSGKVFAVSGKIYSLYYQMGAHSGSLGIPLTDELQVAGGVFRQTFEGGSIQYTATTGPVIRPAVGNVLLSIGTADVLRINLGDSLTIRANIFATTGEQLTDRTTTFVTSNGRIVSVTPNGDGLSAVLKGVGGGTAQITAVADGKASGSLTIFVSAPCCQVGEGSPSTAIQQAFQDAVTRLRLAIQLPAANPVRRLGLGYAQDLLATDGTRYLVCRSDRSPGVFAVSGEILKAYLANGGPSGALAYPITDPTVGGRQMFEGGALAGLPVQAVADPILTRWSGLGFETGALGAPTSVSRASQSFTGASAVSQSFAGGFLLRILTGPFASPAPVPRVILVAGKILLRYASAGGADGDLGFPVSEAYGDGDAIRQNFEGGQLFYRGDGDVEQQDQERKTMISISPGKVVAGGRVRIIIGGFPNGAALQVSFNAQSGIAPFQIQTAQGSYSWEFPVASNVRTGAVTVNAQEVGGKGQASGSYSVVALAEATTQLIKRRGDTQQGLPGALLNQALTVSLADDQGNPLIGIPVKFTATPGSRIEQADAVTDESGEADAFVRLQQSDGIVLITGEAAGKVVTFSARSSGASLNNFPRQMQTGSMTLGATQAILSQKGALLAATSSVIRYRQNRSELPSSLGVSDPVSLNDFLKNFCVLDLAGGRICDGYLTPAGPAEPVVNLWRLKDYVGNNLDVEILSAADTRILDLLNQGTPVIVALALSAGGAPVGSHFVVAVGVSSDGAILIHDPNPVLNRARLDDYLAGFTQSGRSFKATILQLANLVTRSPSPSGFLASSGESAIAVQGPAGACGVPIAWPGSASIDSSGVQPGRGSTNLLYCPGLENAEIVSFSATAAYRATITDLGSPGRQILVSGNGGESYLLTRVNAQWQLDNVTTLIDSGSVVNAASFTQDLAPGSLAVVTGAGLGSTDYVPHVTVGGQDAVVQFASEFRLNVEIPQQIPPGDQSLRVESVHGIAESPISIRDSAPAIFQDAKTGAAVILNATGSQVNTPFNPVARGGAIGIYATGLGALRQQGNTRVTVSPVTVVVQGMELNAVSTTPAANLPGVYVVAVVVGNAVAPGLNVPLSIRQNGVDSNTVSVSIR